MSSFPFCKQPDAMDCGPACLKMVAEHYGRRYSLDTLRAYSSIGREGVSMLGISNAAENNYEVNCSFEKLERKPQDRIIDLYEQTLYDGKSSIL